MRSHRVVVVIVFPEQEFEVAFAKGHEMVQALVLDGLDEPFGVCVQIRRCEREPLYLDAISSEDCGGIWTSGEPSRMPGRPFSGIEICPPRRESHPQLDCETCGGVDLRALNDLPVRRAEMSFVAGQQNLAAVVDGGRQNGPIFLG